MLGAKALCNIELKEKSAVRLLSFSNSKSFTLKSEVNKFKTMLEEKSRKIKEINGLRGEAVVIVAVSNRFITKV